MQKKVDENFQYSDIVTRLTYDEVVEFMLGQAAVEIKLEVIVGEDEKLEYCD